LMINEPRLFIQAVEKSSCQQFRLDIVHILSLQNRGQLVRC
jgi:hypothetical protein